MKSLRMMLFPLTLGVFAWALPLERSGESSTDAPIFDAGQYKEYITNLKCPKIETNHDAMKIPEIGGTLYNPSPSTLQQHSTSPSQHPSASLPQADQPSSPAPLPSITESTPSHLTLSNSSSVGLLPANDTGRSMAKKIKREERQELPEESTSQPDLPDEVTPEEDVDEDTEDEPEDESENEPENEASANSTEECTAPLTKEWINYNWYQVLLDNGGPPGAFLPERFTWNFTKVLNPCARPVVITSKEKETFGFTHSKFEKVHRAEHVRVVFPGTPHEFIDVTGRLVWAPPNSTRRYFHMKYRKDDTGLYFKLDEQRKCVFIDDDSEFVDCEYVVPVCDCSNGKESCVFPIHEESFSPALMAALVGGG